MIILWIIYALTLLYILRDAVVINSNILISRRWSKNEVKKMQLTDISQPNIIILLPVLCEQLVLRSSLEHLVRLPYPGKKQIIVITTEREVKENGGIRAGTTPELAECLAKEFNKIDNQIIRIIHEPFLIGNRSTQLNYALSILEREGEFDLAKTYIAVYDADSRPGKDSLISVGALVAKEELLGRKWPIAIQQPSLFIKNFSKVSWYLKLEGLFETRWALGHEVRTQRATTKKHPDWAAPYAYVVGHGMFIKLEYLTKTGGFPEPCDDVPMGLRLNFAGIPIHPLPTYDLSEVAPNVNQLIKQSGRWFMGSCLIWDEYRKIKQTCQKVRPLRAFTLLLKGIVDIFTWIHYPLHLMALLFLLALGATEKIIVFSIIGYYLDSGIGMVLMLKILSQTSEDVDWKINRIPNLIKLLLVILAPIRGFVRGLAPLIGIKIWFDMKYRGVSLPKTERA